MGTGSDHITVRFEGEGEGTGELAWGQQEAWMSIRRIGSWMPLGGVKTLPQGTTVEDVAAELRYLMSRFQVLRTLVRVDAGHHPTQQVFARGEIDLDLVDAGGDDPAEVAARVRRRYAETALDLTSEWPIRMGVVLDRDVPTHMIALVSHFAVDAHGAQQMLADVAAGATAQVTGKSPLEQAEWQQSAPGLRQNEAALRHHEAVLRSIAPSRFPPVADPDPDGAVGAVSAVEAAVWSGEFTSRALPRAIRRISALTEVDAATALLTLFAVALTRITGVNPVALRPLVGNRFRSGLADVVCSAAQSGLCALDVADVPFDEALARVKRATMTAYKHAYHNPFDLEDLVERVSRERAADIDIACFFNNRRGESPTAGAYVPSLEEAQKVLEDSVFRWTKTGQTPMRRTFARVETDVADAMRLSVQSDSRVLSTADGEAWLRGIESIALEVASGA